MELVIAFGRFNPNFPNDCTRDSAIRLLRLQSQGSDFGNRKNSLRMPMISLAGVLNEILLCNPPLAGLMRLRGGSADSSCYGCVVVAWAVEPASARMHSPRGHPAFQATTLASEMMRSGYFRQVGVNLTLAISNVPNTCCDDGQKISGEMVPANNGSRERACPHRFKNLCSPIVV